MAGFFGIYEDQDERQMAYHRHQKFIASLKIMIRKALEKGDLAEAEILEARLEAERAAILWPAR